MDPLPGYTGADLFAINDVGQAVGISYAETNQWRAMLWDNGTVIDLGVPEGYLSSTAIGVNNAGQIVGDALGPGNYGYLWTMGAGFQVLGPNGGGAIGLNNRGDIINGPSAIIDGEGHAFQDLFPANTDWDLNSLLPVGITDNGLMFGTGIRAGDCATGQCKTSAFVLTPVAVPEPPPYALLLIAFALPLIRRKSCSSRLRRVGLAQLPGPNTCFCANGICTPSS